MSLSALAAIFMVSLLGGVHCAGMCGGIVAALSPRGPRANGAWRIAAGYHVGRITTYMSAGAIAGAAGSMALFYNDVLPVQVAMYLLANLMLIALGLYLLGTARYVAWMERAGARLWRLLRPLAGRLLPANTLPKALALGMLWGWLPCGLVYSVLATALLAGDATGGALVMLAFGLGTLPNLLFGGALLRALSRHGAGAALRKVAGGLVLLMGLAGLSQAGQVRGAALSSVLCMPLF